MLAICGNRSACICDAWIKEKNESSVIDTSLFCTGHPSSGPSKWGKFKIEQSSKSVVS